MSKRLVGFMNAYTQGKSGGDIWFIEVAKRMTQYDKIVVTSLLGKELCEKQGLKADYLITTREEEFKNVVFTYLKRIIKVLFIKVKGDIFYVTSDFLPDVLPAFMGKLRGSGASWIQKIYHLIPLSRPIPYYAQKVSFFFIKKGADLVFVDNNLLKEDLVKKGFNPDRIVVVIPGIDIEYIQNITPAGTGFDGVFLGRLKLSKGIFDLIDIWGLVCKESPSSRLGIIGYADNEIKRIVEKKIRGSGLSKNIFLLGYLSDEEAFGVIKASKVFVFPSHEEGFGIAIAEAMACGVPIVVYDLPVYRENFPKGIVTVQVGRVESFARTIIGLLGNRDKYIELKNSVLEGSKQFSWDKTVEREIGCIEEVR